MKKRNFFIGLIALLILVLTLVVSYETRNEYSLMDRFFVKIGLNPWSGDGLGFHRTVVLTLGLLIASVYVIKLYWKDIFPVFIKRFNIILIVGILLFPKIALPTQNFIKGFSDDLNSIYYDRSNSRVEYRFEENKLYVNGYIYFENYSDKPLEFYVILVPEKDTLIKTNLTILDENGEQRLFKINGKEKMNFEFKFILKQGKYEANITKYYFSGDIIIYNEDQTVEIIKKLE